MRETIPHEVAWRDLRAANRLIGKTCRRVNRREKLDRWAQAVMDGSILVVAITASWTLVVWAIMAVFGWL